MNHHLKKLLLCACLAVAAPAWSAPPEGCGVFSIDRLIAKSTRIRQVQMRLVDEFSARTADLTARHQRIRQVELSLHTLPGSAPTDQRSALESELASGQASFSIDSSAYQADMVRRTREVLARVLEDVTPFYKAIGIQRGLARLYQEGLEEPLFSAAPDGDATACADKVDLTDEVVQAYDKGSAARPE